MPNNIYSCPPADEIELTVFGPGVGESILVHCGDGNWIIVDSALQSQEPFALKYLREIGVDPEKSVKLIVCTHWHADHVKGIKSIVETCKNAKFVCSGALSVPEFRNLVARFSDEDKGAIRAPLKDLKDTFAHLASINKTSGYIPPKFTGCDTLLLSMTVQERKLEIWALSPSDDDNLKAKEAFAGLMVPLSDHATGISGLTPNHASVVIRIQIGEHAVLLGADLENPKGQHRGWNAIVSSNAEPKSCAFKVPHHGSADSHSPEVWEQMLVDGPHAVVTSFTTHGLPNTDQIEILKRNCSNIYLTSPATSKKIKRSSEIEHTIREVTKSHHMARTDEIGGTVRMRSSINSVDQWSVELFGSAYKL